MPISNIDLWPLISGFTVQVHRTIINIVIRMTYWKMLRRVAIVTVADMEIQVGFFQYLSIIQLNVIPFCASKMSHQGLGYQKCYKYS